MKKKKMGSKSGIGKRQSDLRKSFQLALRSLLTTSPPQEFSNAFPNFSSAQQERLHLLFVQVITSLHANIQDEFESLCLETQVGTVLDTVEQLVEEQCLDPLFSDKTNMMDAVHNLSTAKNAEIQHLRDLLERAEERNCFIQAQVELLKNRMQAAPGTTYVVEKCRCLTFLFRWSSLDSISTSQRLQATALASTVDTGNQKGKSKIGESE